MNRLRKSSSTALLRYFASSKPLLADTPVIVNDGRVEDEDRNASDDEEIELPPVSAFEFGSVTRAVAQEEAKLVGAIDNAVNRYRTDMSTELKSIARTQDVLTEKMAKLDVLAAKTLEGAHKNSQLSASQAKDLQAIDRLATAAEATYHSMTSIVSLLHEIEDALPARERLKPANSAHRSHYPRLHRLLRASDRPRPRRSTSMGALQAQATPAEASDTWGTVPRMSRTPSSSNSSHWDNPLSLQSNLPENYPEALLALSSVAPTRKTNTNEIPQPRPQGRSRASRQAKAMSWFGGPSREPMSAEDELRRLIDLEGPPP